MEKEAEAMNRESEMEKDPHRRRWRGGPLVGLEGERVDELLELIWTLREKGVSDIDQLLETVQDVEARSILRLMVRDDLFEIEGTRIVLKDRGEEKARGLVRRHRLTERFFSELFEMPEEEAEADASQLEQILRLLLPELFC